MRSYGTSKRGALAFCLPHTNTTTLFELEHPSCPDSRNLRQTPSCPPFASIVYLHRRSLAQLPETLPPVRSSIYPKPCVRLHRYLVKGGSFCRTAFASHESLLGVLRTLTLQTDAKR